MKSFFLILSFLATLNATALETNTGRSVSGPGTMGHPTYPNSGQSNSTMGSEVDQRVSSENPEVDKRAKSNRKLPQGPYIDESRIHHEKGLKGKQAQEAADEKSFGHSKKEIKKKQEGY